jgi:hypothetical protein
VAAAKPPLNRAGEVRPWPLNPRTPFIKGHVSTCVAKVLNFPNSSGYAALRVPTRAKHTVWVRIIDRRRPNQARWHLQWPLLRAAGGRCLKGFNNALAQRRGWHQILVRDPLLRRFLLDCEELVLHGRVEIIVDGRMVKAA